MKRAWALFTGFICLLMLVTVTSTFAGQPTDATDSSEKKLTAERSMEVIRKAAQTPHVRNKLKQRGLSESDIEYRLTMLDRNLSGQQKRHIAMKITETSGDPSKKKLPQTPGNQFLASTLDWIFTIILIPVYLLSWIIPGL